LADDNIDEIEISKRIGMEIEPVHKEYFNLFPNIKSFKSAKLYKINDSIVQFEIASTPDGKIKYDTLPFLKSTHSILEKLIENYEYIVEFENKGQIFEIIWSSELLKIVTPKLNFNDYRNAFKFKMSDNTIISGDLMWADSSFLVLAPDNSQFNWKDVEIQYKVYHFSEISSVLIPGKREFLGREDIYLLNLNYFQELSSFIEINLDNEYIVVPEINNLISEKKKSLKYEKPVQFNSIEELISLRQRDYTFVIEIGSNVLYENFSNFILLQNFQGETLLEIPWKGLKTNYPSIIFEYPIVGKLNFGTGLNYISDDFSYSPAQRSGIISKGFTVTTYLNYTPNYRNIFDFDFASNFEISYKIGTIIGLFSNQIVINEYLNTQIYTNFDELNFQDIIFGGSAGIKLAYFITEKLSLNLQGLCNFVLPVKIEDWNHRIIYLKDQNFNYTGVGVIFGLGFKL
jgi:hypothetical protein